MIDFTVGYLIFLAVTFRIFVPVIPQGFSSCIFRPSSTSAFFYKLVFVDIKVP